MDTDTAAPNEGTLRRILSEVMGFHVDHFRAGQKLEDDLGADSLDTAELLMAVEDEFDIEISDDEAEKVQTVGELLTLINSKVSS